MKFAKSPDRDRNQSYQIFSGRPQIIPPDANLTGVYRYYNMLGQLDMLYGPDGRAVLLEIGVVAHESVLKAMTYINNKGAS